MQVDKTTLSDLAIFHREEEQSIFHQINFTTTIGGKDRLHHLLAHPLSDLHQIHQTQQILKFIIENESKWPTVITNGTIMVIQKFYESSVDAIPNDPHFFNSLIYKTVKAADFSLIRFSVIQFANFFIGLQQILVVLSNEENPPLLNALLNRIQLLTAKPVVKKMMALQKPDTLSTIDILTFGNFLLYHFKQQANELIDIFNHLDAYRSMAIATERFSFCFPEILKADCPFIEGVQLKHLMVNNAVAYDIKLHEQKNFQFLTGANMGGKSTYIKAVGVAVYLAHVGMGVPASSLKLSLFDGLLSNIQVEDNISKGESYFYNEVQRIKKTIEQINDGRNWFILIDELFKGTNVQDAMKCSTSVIEGLRKMKKTLFILSTHLYEIGESLKKYPNIQFDYFETNVEGDQLHFSYNLKEGISNDRLGYLILQREGVVDMLNKL